LMNGGLQTDMINTEYDFSSAKCMLCGNNGLSFVNILRDDDTHWAAKCKACYHIQLTPLPTVEEEESYYQTNELYSISRMDERELVKKLEQLVTMQYEILADKITAPADIIEIGSGYGLFLEKAILNGYSAHGIELSKEKAAYCMNRTGIMPESINLVCEDVPDALTGKFDVVLMFFLLEHIINPIVFLKRSAELLNASGRIVLLVPNANAYLKNYCDEYKDFHYLRPHISYFSAEILSHVLVDAGFINVEVFGKQQYSVENAIHWARNKAPFLAYSQLDMPPGLEFVNEFYKNYMEKELVSDMLVAVGTWIH